MGTETGASPTIDVGGLTLFSGDKINLVADNDTFLKRFAWVWSDSDDADHCAILCYNRYRDEFSDFVVRVTGKNQISLQAENGHFLKRLGSCGGQSFIAVDKPSPDLFSYFTVKKVENQVIRLKADNDKYLKRDELQDDYEGKGIIVVDDSPPTVSAEFEVRKLCLKAKETIVDMDFDLTSMTREDKPLVLHKERIVNGSPEEKQNLIQFTESISTAKTFTWKNNFSLDETTCFSANVPFGGSVGSIINRQISFSQGGSEASANTRTFMESQWFRCPPSTAATVEATATLATIEVPFVATMERTMTDGQKFAYKIPGMFKNVDTFGYLFTIAVDD